MESARFWGVRVRVSITHRGQPTGSARGLLTITIGGLLLYGGAANGGPLRQEDAMIDRYFSAPKTLRRLRGGLSGAYIDGFADALTRDGYAPRDRRPVPARGRSPGRVLDATTQDVCGSGRRHRRERFVVIFDGVAVPPPMVAGSAITRPSACSAFRPI